MSTWNKITKGVEAAREKAAHAYGDARFGLIVVRDGQIQRGKESVPLAGARLTVETAGDVDRRITATRLLLTGPFALGLRKKKDNRELYITVENDGSAFVAEVDAKQGKAAREFAAKVNTMAANALRETPRAPSVIASGGPVPAPPGTPADWLADPTGRADLRYWDGAKWTEHVVTGGEQGTDSPT